VVTAKEIEVDWPAPMEVLLAEAEMLVDAGTMVNATGELALGL
jgi:hypothetical protein